MAEAPATSGSSDSGACPPPLAWHEVIATVERDAEAFQVSRDGIDLDALVLGTGSPLWFLNGFAGDRMQFALLAWLLKDRFRCVLLNTRWTDKAPKPAELPHRLANAISRTSEELSQERIALFATSFGSLVALDMLLGNPTKLRGVVLHTAFANRHYSLTERLAAKLGLWSKSTIGTFRPWKAIQESNNRRWFPPIDPPRWDFLLSNLGSTPASVLGRRVLAASANDYSRRLNEIQTPVQLIRTEGDGRVVASAMDELAVGLPNVRDETLHTTGHFAFVTHPHRVAKIVTSFFDGLS